jgi:hypothetical protein
MEDHNECQAASLAGAGTADSAAWVQPMQSVSTMVQTTYAMEHACPCTADFGSWRLVNGTCLLGAIHN